VSVLKNSGLFRSPSWLGPLKVPKGLLGETARDMALPLERRWPFFLLVDAKVPSTLLGFVWNILCKYVRLIESYTDVTLFNFGAEHNEGNRIWVALEFLLLCK
jgi:hypothetical protein